MSRGPVWRGRAGGRLRTLLGLAALVAGVVLLAVAAGSYVRSSDGGEAHVTPTASQPADARVTPEPRERRTKRTKRAERAQRPALPVRIEIPAIGVRAPIIRLGLNPDRSLEVPKDFGDTGWWSGGSRPGEPGPAVIAGHVDSQTGPAVFYKLRDLRERDTIVVVRRDGSRARFAVVRSGQYSKTEFPTDQVYGRTAGPTLRLITCGGDFDESTGHYVDNTVVYARAA